MATVKKRTRKKKMISEEEAYKAVLQGIREAIREYKVKTKSKRG